VWLLCFIAKQSSAREHDLELQDLIIQANIVKRSNKTDDVLEHVQLDGIVAYGATWNSHVQYAEAGTSLIQATKLPVLDASACNISQIDHDTTSITAVSSTQHHVVQLVCHAPSSTLLQGIRLYSAQSDLS
jgi:hypothetical protein